MTTVASMAKTSGHRCPKPRKRPLSKMEKLYKRKREAKKAKKAVLAGIKKMSASDVREIIRSLGIR